MNALVTFDQNEIAEAVQRAVLLEECLQEYKDIEAELKRVKNQIFEAMKQYDVKSWELPNGTKITRVDDVEPKVTTERIIDLDRFAEEAPEEYAELVLIYGKDVQKYTNGRKGYVKITTKNLNEER